jgi:hypothetical protein
MLQKPTQLRQWITDLRSPLLARFTRSFFSDEIIEEHELPFHENLQKTTYWDTINNEQFILGC